MDPKREIDLCSIENQCKAMSADQAWAAFQRGFDQTAEGLVWMAYALRQLEELKDEHLVAARKMIGERLFNLLRKVAHGNMLPEVFIRYQGRGNLQTLVGNLPMPDQEKLVRGERVEIAVLESGRIDKRMCDPLEMEEDQARMVFAGGRIHTFTEQRARLEMKIAEESVKPPEKLGRAKIDYERAVAELPRGEYSWAELADIVAALRRAR